MWIVLTLLLLLLLFFLGILIMPVEVEINSYRGIYELRAGKIFRFGLLINEAGEISAYMNLAGWQKRYTSLPLMPGKQKKKAKKTQKPAKQKRVTHIFSRVVSVIKSFKIIRLRADINVDDYILNAYLYPAAFLYSRHTGWPVKVNFTGKSGIDILIRNNLLRMGFAFIKYK